MITIITAAVAVAVQGGPERLSGRVHHTVHIGDWVRAGDRVRLRLSHPKLLCSLLQTQRAVVAIAIAIAIMKGVRIEVRVGRVRAAVQGRVLSRERSGRGLIGPSMGLTGDGGMDAASGAVISARILTALANNNIVKVWQH